MSQNIIIRGASTHNLKNISLTIPKNKLVVFTGVSGSGKSSLAFDTIYAEGQRRYLESLSTYARMIISNINEETKVEEIQGLSPTIAIHQKTVSTNPRSTVGTITEIYDFFRLLFTTIGIQKCPNHPEIVLKKQTIADIVAYVSHFSHEDKFAVFAPIPLLTSLGEIKEYVIEHGFVRFYADGKFYSISDVFEDENQKISQGYIVIDRLVYTHDTFDSTRLKDSSELAFKISDEICSLYEYKDEKITNFYRKSTCPHCQYSLQDLTISHFSFNSHYGACPDCHGLGVQVAFLEEKIINPRLTLGEGAVYPYANNPFYSVLLEKACIQEKIPMNVPFEKLHQSQKDFILRGGPVVIEMSHPGDSDKKIHRVKFEGVIKNLDRRYHEGDHEDSFMKKLASYSTEIECTTCEGYKLQKAFLHVFVGGKHIGELTDMPVKDLIVFFSGLSLTKTEEAIAKDILKNIRERLEFLSGVGLGYMSLSRKAQTLSGGESQRIRLATQIGTKLEGIIYVLDEPSIGLHPRDNYLLIQNIKKLTDLGNSVIVVEHDEEVMETADYIVDIGPNAGKHGGEILFQGTYQEMIDHGKTATAEYVSGRKQITRSNCHHNPSSFITIEGATENNLKNITVKIPLGVMTVVTGVSGSGKSSLILDILASHALFHFGIGVESLGACKKISGFQELDKAIIIDQSPIGKTPHSNIATYTGLFTVVREVFAATLDAQRRGYQPGRFSFNTKGGRCEVCEGSGVKKIEMHFLPDVFVECESCQGQRFNPETLEIRFKGKNIAEVLAMTVDEAIDFFAAFPRIMRILQVLHDVGLGYISLGQSAPTLSGGESQRIKLAFDLSKRSTSKTLYILDEPTTGLHFTDIQKLLDILDRLVEKGNSVCIIEHNLDVIAHADWLIDIGPEGGTGGGELLFSGPRDKILSVPESYTAQALEKYWLKHKKHG